MYEKKERKSLYTYNVNRRLTTLEYSAVKRLYKIQSIYLESKKKKDYRIHNLGILPLQFGFLLIGLMVKPSRTKYTGYILANGEICITD
jgi:hypothetical protein